MEQPLTKHSRALSRMARMLEVQKFWPQLQNDTVAVIDKGHLCWVEQKDDGKGGRGRRVESATVYHFNAKQNTMKH